MGCIPVFAGIYIWALRRRRRLAVRYSSLALVRAAAPPQSWLRRHLPASLFLLALASLSAAAGRPAAVVNVPTGETTIILAIDTSISMCYTDIYPSRLEAAKSAALSFIQRQDANIQIGIVAFEGYALLIQPPTTDQAALEAAILKLTTGKSTAIGGAILTSLQAIAEIDPPASTVGSDRATANGQSPARAGATEPGTIILLTDGVNSAGPEPLEAAWQAAERRVPVHTIGFGTAFDESDPPGCSQSYPGGGPGGVRSPGGGGAPAGSWYLSGIDEAALIEIAELTGGSYFPAATASELESVFRQLPVTVTTRQETQEISVVFIGLGALLAAAAFLLGQYWHPLP